nr:MAG TPA: hypothetical protein [Caudoviricetes sp.]
MVLNHLPRVFFYINFNHLLSLFAANIIYIFYISMQIIDYFHLKIRKFIFLYILLPHN